MIQTQINANASKPLQDLCPVGKEEEKFFKNSRPTNPNFPRTALINWQSALESLHGDALVHLERFVSISNRYWAISHVVSGDAFDWRNGRPLTTLKFRVVALQKGEPIPWHRKKSVGEVLFDSSTSDWWNAFTHSLRKIDVTRKDAPMYGGEWESYFETVYRALVITALRLATDTLGLVRDTSVNLAPWPTTGVSMSDMIAPNDKLHLFMNFDGETAEEALSEAYGIHQFAPAHTL